MPGSIHDNVKSFFRTNPREKDIIKPFLAAGFDITWANIRAYERTTISVIFIRPSEELAESYGFEYEIILAYAKYETLEPRTIRAIEHVFTSDPAKGRVEPLLCFLVSEAKDVDGWVTSYLLENKESRIVVPFSASTLTSGEANEWSIKNQIQKHFLLLDRYNYTSPLKEETYFFGRSNELGQIIDFSRRSENAAVFGLRKTGKTSILYKLKRILEKDPRHRVYLFDAQSPSFRKRRWNQALKYIADRISENVPTEKPRDFDELDAADDFVYSINHYIESLALERITIVID